MTPMRTTSLWALWAVALIGLGCRPAGKAHGRTFATGGSAGPSIPAPPSNCAPQPGFSSYWIELLDAAKSPRMVEIFVQHDSGVTPVATALSSAVTAQKQLSEREKDATHSRVILLSSTNTLGIPSGPIACLRYPTGTTATLDYPDSSFAPAATFPTANTVAIYPSEVSP